jgi:hypothetical protein
MGILSIRGRLVVMSSCVVVWGALYACSVDDENPATDRPRDNDSGQTSSGSVAPDNSPPPVTAALCAKFGGADGVKAMATSIIQGGKVDCRIASVVSQADGHDEECFQLFLQGGFLCPGVTYVAGTTKDSKGDKCGRVLQGLSFSNKDWTVFADFNVDPPSLAHAQVNAKNVTADELRSAAAVFEGIKAGLINNDVPKDKFTQCGPNCPIGGEACIPEVIDGGGKDTGTGPTDSGPGTTDDGSTDASPE